MAKILIALGGNALGNTPSEQKEAVKKTAKVVVKLKQAGNEIVIVHGNGPQVGLINNAFLEAYKNKVIPEMFAFPECGSLSQGYIGFHLQNAIDNELLKQNISTNVVTIITQTLVDKNDLAFKNPTKPIGNFMSQEDAETIAKDNNYIVKEDAGRGYRRVVASPKPQDIIEKEVIQQLLDNHNIVIAGGGGGIPVYKDGNKLIGVEAVVDKDFTAALLAKLIKADSLIILTAVDNVILNYGKENEMPLKEVSLKELDVHIKNKMFAPGSMLPKILAAYDFVKETNNPSFIANLNQADRVLTRKAGTKIKK